MLKKRRVEFIAIAVLVIVFIAFFALTGTKITDKAVSESPTENGSEAHLGRDVSVSEYITLGKYIQSGEEASPIEWLVLDTDGDTALVISRYALECKPYNETSCGVTWENSTLRQWLNGEFLNTAFDSEEQKLIRKAKIENTDNMTYMINGGEDTFDRIFCLSIYEAERYGNRIMYMTDNAANKYGNPGKCWLRSPGNINRLAAFSDANGNISNFGTDVSDKCAVRPAFYINL